MINKKKNSNVLIFFFHWCFDNKQGLRCEKMFVFSRTALIDTVKPDCWYQNTCFYKDYLS